MIKNAIIKSTTLGREDHGIMTFFITIQGEKGTCVAIGGYALDEYNPNTDTRVFKSESMEIISKILEVVGVDSWEKLPGKYIRFEDSGWGSIVTKIGNIIDDKWIDIKEFFSVKGISDRS